MGCGTAESCKGLRAAACPRSAPAGSGPVISLAMLFAAAASPQELDWLDKSLIGVHVAAMGLYVVGGLWIKIPIARAQKAIPPGQAAIVGQRVGFDFTLVSWFAFIAVGITGYWLLGRAGDIDLTSPYTFFIDHGILDGSYGWALFIMVLLWVLLVISGLIMTVVLRPLLGDRLDPTETTDALDPFQRRLTSAIFWIDALAWTNLVLAGGAFTAGLVIGLEHTVLRVT